VNSQKKREMQNTSPSPSGKKKTKTGRGVLDERTAAALGVKYTEERDKGGMKKTLMNKKDPGEDRPGAWHVL